MNWRDKKILEDECEGFERELEIEGRENRQRRREKGGRTRS